MKGAPRKKDRGAWEETSRHLRVSDTWALGEGIHYGSQTPKKGGSVPQG